MKNLKTFEEHSKVFKPKNTENRYNSLVSQVLNILPIIEEKKEEWIKAFQEYSKYFSKIENLESIFSKLSDEEKIRCEEIFKINLTDLYDAVTDAPMYPGNDFKDRLKEINGLKKLMVGSGYLTINTIEDLIEATKNSNNINFYYDFEDLFGNISYPVGRGSKRIPVTPKQHKKGVSLKIEYSENLQFIHDLLKSLNKNGFTSELIKDNTILISSYKKQK